MGVSRQSGARKEYWMSDCLPVQSWMMKSFILVMLMELGRAVAQPGTECVSPNSTTPGGNLILLPKVPENLPVGAVAGQLFFNGGDSDILTSLAAPNPYFRYDSTTRTFIVNQSLVAQNTDISLRLTCEIVTSGNRFIFTILLVIDDLNDHPPVFEKPLYTVHVSENMPAGATVVEDIKATDADPSNWYITYEIMDGPFSDYFYIPVVSIGKILLAKPLDYDTNQVMNLTVMAKDKPLEDMEFSLNSTAIVTINVIDENDQNPVFPFPQYYVGVIQENSTRGTFVVINPPIYAYDSDVDINSSVNYELLPDPVYQDSSYFRINSTTAQIVLEKDALERGRRFDLVVKATETTNVDRFSSSLVRIRVQAANENPPKFVEKLLMARLVENSPLETIVAIVTAIDNDPDGAITYRIQPPHDTFNVDSNSGVVRTVQALRAQGQLGFTLTIVASDGLYEDRAEIQIEILETNDHNPVFGETSYNFSGKKEQGFIIGQVQATDEDYSSVITYNLASQQSIFSIDSQSGQISVSGDVELIKNQNLELFVVATDNGLPSRASSAVVMVTFDIEPVAVVTEGETDVVVIIVLAVLIGCLLLIIIILLIYIYTSRYPPSPVTKSQSFERKMNISSEKSRNVYSHTGAPEGLAYTLRAHSLAVYTDAELEEASATTQENPFRTNNSSSGESNTSQDNYTYDLHPQLETVKPPNETLYASIKPKYKRAGSENHQLFYDTGVEPMHDDTMSAETGSRSTITESVPHMYQEGTGTFRGMPSNMGHTDSTLALVTPKGSVAKRGYSNVSFVDGETSQGRSRSDRPGITVYY